MDRATVVLHGHFYQPPREDPWTDRIRSEPGAAPFENWNDRIAAECYEPLARAGAFDWLSFDLGPTLARWLEGERPEVHEGFVRGDRASRERLGHGNAVAQPYHHIILPLATRREKETEVRWGLRDFERRFGRCADGMWLPETAVDMETLDVLAAEGVAFTILAPHQVADVPAGGVGRVRIGAGREIAVFIYDGELSHGVAFGALLDGRDAWFEALRSAAGRDGGVVALATDGETFGHHHRGADRTLMRVIRRARESGEVEIGNFGAALAAASEVPFVSLEEPTSWSCAHGVERWRSECGCRMAPHLDSQQRWRAPLRSALESLAAGLDAAYAELAPGRLTDPGRAMEALGEVLGAPPGLEDFAARAAGESGGGERRDEALALLEVARDRAAMFTSCAWFFDDVAGLEARQVLGYAAHALDRLRRLAPERSEALETAFVADLAKAPANDADLGNAAAVYERAFKSDAGFPVPADA
ncbi:MAG: DUF3536 domain-containing protein [Gemmatimonadota bacterium]|uniref:DUF3536 domain-containing protein n=1 Tax=Candidatus Palauibacter scopulicola TaxID=3056741 RepID=UPI00239CA593|nr:DUF3536 domain-containing protein [Candidatus Palauibacter scopulicola]MDE2662989.1 DUF3536 domain-containing protein [Candidatus Palauibacter scopulicola]